jgi:hypothetical protein
MFAAREVTDQTQPGEQAGGGRERPGRYLTDGVHLFRLVEPFDRLDGSVVGLEDCRSLEVRMMRAEEFRLLPLREVGSA